MRNRSIRHFHAPPRDLSRHRNRCCETSTLLRDRKDVPHPEADPRLVRPRPIPPAPVRKPAIENRPEFLEIAPDIVDFALAGEIEQSPVAILSQKIAGSRCQRIDMLLAGPLPIWALGGISHISACALTAKSAPIRRSRTWAISRT